MHPTNFVLFEIVIFFIFHHIRGPYNYQSQILCFMYFIESLLVSSQLYSILDVERIVESGNLKQLDQIAFKGLCHEINKVGKSSQKFSLFRTDGFNNCQLYFMANQKVSACFYDNNNNYNADKPSKFVFRKLALAFRQSKMFSIAACDLEN